MSTRQMPSNGGIPSVSNANRKLQKRLDRTARERVRVVSDRGRIARKRKKFINDAERGHYKALVLVVMNHLASNRQAS